MKTAKALYKALEKLSVEERIAFGGMLAEKPVGSDKSNLHHLTLWSFQAITYAEWCETVSAKLDLEFMGRYAGGIRDECILRDHAFEVHRPLMEVGFTVKAGGRKGGRETSLQNEAMKQSVRKAWHDIQTQHPLLAVTAIRKRIAKMKIASYPTVVKYTADLTAPRAQI